MKTDVIAIPMTVEQVLSKLAQGEWFVSGGSLYNWKVSQQLVVFKYVFPRDKFLHITTPRETFDLPNDDIVEAYPGHIFVYETFMRREMKKKVEGGGWRTVPTRRVALVLFNPEIDASEHEALRIEAEENNKRWMEIAEETKEKEVREFEGILSKKFGGKTIAEVQVRWGFFMLKFTDGEELKVELEGGDLDDAWMVVDGRNT